MGSEPVLSERLQWTLSWQSRHLVPELARPRAEERLRAYWQSARHMDDVLARIGLDGDSLSVDVGGGLTTPLPWLPGRRICVDPLSEHYADRFPLPLDRVIYAPQQGESLPVLSGSADLVICTNCIDHTDDPKAVIREVARVLHPGGWFWFTCEARSPDQRRNPGHPHALDQDAIRALVAGFDVALAWEEPWRGVYRFLRDLEPTPHVELGFLLRQPGGPDGS